ncbi:metalloprotease TIKI1 isoform X1 [Hippopotamus amphibius kiboko]|uniref:metalloprotease TIKI1 isoform X1 n=1 Tax=Hippopotamus amphibius kiboko TaxID=575201 RepID=UPI0025936BD2|nr:metalloprotease TIKI1 isoform X1 [Hippopotamus amphibius kiboko]
MAGAGRWVFPSLCAPGLGAAERRMSPWSLFLLPTLCLLPASAAPPRGARVSADCELKPQQSELNSFLWTIKRDPPSYFFGTIHVLYTRVWGFIPDSSKEAFQQSSIVYFELDLMDPYTASALTSCQMLPQGENLQDVLPRDIYCRLKRHLKYIKLMMPSWMMPDQRDKGLYADYLFSAIAGNWERKRPVWVMLMVNSLTEVDIKSRGVPVLDLYLAQEAERLRKQTGAVEKVEEQCRPLNGLNFSQVIFALNQTLLQQESLRAGGLQIPYTTEDLIKHYNCGDLSAIIFSHDSSQIPNFINSTLPPQERITAQESITAQEIDSYFRWELIYKRNERIGKRVKALLGEFPDKGFFFAFGAGHFMGNNTVLHVLRREGCEVEHAPAGRPISKEKARNPSSHPASSATLAPEAPAPEAQIPEAGSAGSSLCPPHVSQPGRADLPGEARRRRKFRKKRRRPQRRQRLRQFSDLWVRLKASAVIPQLQAPIVDRGISAELRLPCPGLSPHSQLVASSACLPLWTPVFWVPVLASQTETPLL